MEENQILENTSEQAVTPEQETPATDTVELTSEPVILEVEPVAAEAPAAPKKKLPVALLCVIGVLVVAGIVAFASGVFSSPKAAVTKALAATYAQQNALTDQIIEEIPLMKLFYNPSEAPSKTSFDFTFDKVTTGSAEDAMVNGLLSGAGVKGSVASDNAKSMFAIDGSLHLGEMDLIKLYMFLSPELAAGNVPTFSDTVLSVNPKTLGTDMKASPLYPLMGMSDAQIDEMQNTINSQLESVGTFSATDYKQMQDEMLAIVGKVMTNATYTKGEKEGNLKTYNVMIPGADVKAMFSEVMRYIYMDSPFTALYQTMFTGALLDGKSYEEFIEQDIMAMIDEQLTMADVNVLFKVGAKNLINGAVVTMPLMKTAAEGAEAVQLGDITMNYTSTGDFDQTIDVMLKMSENDAPMAMKVSATAKYIDGVYDILVNMEMSPAENIKMSVVETVKMDKNGLCNLNMDMNMGDMYGIGTDLIYNIKCEGTIKDDAGKIVVDYPTLGFTMDLAGQQMGINFIAKATTETLTEIETPKESKPLFAMTEAELTAEMENYSNGMNSIMGTIFSMMMGGAMPEPVPEGTAVPEADAAASIGIIGGADGPTSIISEQPVV